MNTIMVVADMYVQQPTAKNAGRDLDDNYDKKKTGIVLSRKYAEEINSQYKNGIGIKYYKIDEEASKEWYEKNQELKAERKAVEEAERLKKEGLADAILQRALNGEKSEDKPKKKRRTKAEIEADEANTTED